MSAQGGGTKSSRNTFLFRFTSAETPPLRGAPNNRLPKTHLTIQNAKKSSASGFLAQYLLPPNTRQASLGARGFQAVEGIIWKLTSGAPQPDTGSLARLPRLASFPCGQVRILVSGFRVYAKYTLIAPWSPRLAIGNRARPFTCRFGSHCRQNASFRQSRPPGMWRQSPSTCHATAATTILPSARRCTPTQILPSSCALGSDRPKHVAVCRESDS
jgi:hypothetical protein